MSFVLLLPRFLHRTLTRAKTYHSQTRSFGQLDSMSYLHISRASGGIEHGTPSFPIPFFPLFFFLVPKILIFPLRAFALFLAGHKFAVAALLKAIF